MAAQILMPPPTLLMPFSCRSSSTWMYLPLSPPIRSQFKGSSGFISPDDVCKVCLDVVTCPLQSLLLMPCCKWRPCNCLLWLAKGLEHTTSRGFGLHGHPSLTKELLAGWKWIFGHGTLESNSLPSRNWLFVQAFWMHISDAAYIYKWQDASTVRLQHIMYTVVQYLLLGSAMNFFVW